VLRFSEKIPGTDDDEAASADDDSDDDGFRADDDDIEDENEDFLKEFENGETDVLYMEKIWSWVFQFIWDCDHSAESIEGKSGFSL